MVDVIWDKGALGDLNDIVDHIEQHDEAAAHGVRRRLIACGESLSTFPARGRPAARGQHEMTTVPPYVLTYLLDVDEVRIVSIRHGRRRPLA